ncbi:hypothetical protein FOMPIDRAFT_1061166 [Fomitopsis schrenkii]|uniref:Autophagy-related protein 29 n=1 Tax=Fomitopsis schrenkii TaxID=2126942 RepID=S8E0S8_FOMSC|nr:hypothetical protein FOMPIDRAFT_1061166 [Fomitopsis schrenkii]
MAANPPMRVIVRLPYNRPEDPPPDPPRVEWTAEKEQMLWEVVDKYSAIKGATTDWEGLAAHLQVPVPYLIHRTRTRFEEGLRGLQGIRTISTPTVPAPFSPASQHPPPPSGNEYFPRLPEGIPRRLSNSGGGRPLGVRARLSSLGSLRARRGSVVRHAGQRQSILGQVASGSGGTTAKKVSSSSTLTLQGPRRSRGSDHRPLTPAALEADADADGLGDDEGSDEDEAARKEEEDEREAEARELERKLEKLQLMMTTDALGLVASPAAIREREKGKQVKDRGRARPLESSTASLSSAPQSASRSQQSLSSLSSRGSPQGSIPSIPSSPPRAETQHARRYSYAEPRVPYAQRQDESLSPTSSSPRMVSPIPRHLSPPGQSHSPPALSSTRAVGQTYMGRTPRSNGGQGWRVDVGVPTNGRVSSQGSDTSSFSDLSESIADASLTASALESALSSNIRGNGSRLSSFARSHLTGRRGVR